MTTEEESFPLIVRHCDAMTDDSGERRKYVQGSTETWTCDGSQRLGL